MHNLGGLIGYPVAQPSRLKLPVGRVIIKA